jgi:serine protease Do
MLKLTIRIVVLSVIGSVTLLADDGLRERIKDANGARIDVWVYNDIAKGMEQARKENKPIFVTFRCVPCKDCAAFDADVANGNERVREIAKEKFISVRQVEMKGVDLSLFQFDHDLNWAGMFINADGVVYARYGTQSAEGSDAYNSIEGLVNTMNRVLELHANYPKNLAELQGKRGAARSFKTALEMPGLQNPEKFAQQTERGNCIHCHNIHDAEQVSAKKSGSFTQDMLWRYPLPDNVGLSIDRISGIKIAEIREGSSAAKSGLKVGEDVVRMNGQRITSIADMQWVLHHLPNTTAEVIVEGSQSGKQTLSLSAGWKKYDISWRGSIWSLSPKFPAWTPILSVAQRDELGIPKSDTAFEVKSINRNMPGGKNAYEAGLRIGDVIVAIEGQPVRMTPQQFNVHVRLNHKPGDKLPLTVLGKDGKRRELQIPLAE